MKTYSKCLTVAVLAGALNSLSAGEIAGKVTLKGTPKPEITVALDATCGALHTGSLTTRHYVVSADKGLANVFVYLKEGAKAAPAFSRAREL